MNEQRLFEEYSFSLKSQLNQFTYWFMELSPIQQMICSNLTMHIVSGPSLQINEHYLKGYIDTKYDVIKASNSFEGFKDISLLKMNLMDAIEILKTNLCCFRHSRCDKAKELHSFYYDILNFFMNQLTSLLTVKGHFGILDSDKILQDIEIVIGTFLLHPDFNIEEKRSISDIIMKSLKNIDPQSYLQPGLRINDVERFLIYLLSLFDEVLVYASFIGDKMKPSVEQESKAGGTDASRLLKDFLHLPRYNIANSGYSSLRSSGFISECENSSSQISIPSTSTYFRYCTLRRESDDKYRNLNPGLFRMLPMRRQSASPFYNNQNTSNGSTAMNNGNNGHSTVSNQNSCGSTSNHTASNNGNQSYTTQNPHFNNGNNKNGCHIPTMTSLYNFNDIKNTPSHNHVGGGHHMDSNSRLTESYFGDEFKQKDGLSCNTNNPHIEIHVLSDCYGPNDKKQMDNIDPELIFNNPNSVPNQCFLQPNSPLGGLSRASSGSFQSSELNSSESPYFSIFDQSSSPSAGIKGQFHPDNVFHSSSSNRRSNGKHVNGTRTHYASGMQNVIMWLKNLRLHKYTDIFKDISYGELMNITDVWLENNSVTQGAKNKILINIAKLHDRSTNLEVMKLKLDKMHTAKDSLGKNSLVSLKGCLSDLRQILLSPIHPYTADVAGSQVDYQIEDLPSQILENVVKITDFCCCLETVDYDSEARILEIYNLISDNEAFTHLQKEAILECQAQMASVHNLPEMPPMSPQRTSPKLDDQKSYGSQIDKHSYYGLPDYDESYLNYFNKKIIERTFSEPHNKTCCIMQNSMNQSHLNATTLMSSHDTIQQKFSNQNTSNTVYDSSNMSLTCSENFSGNTLSHVDIDSLTKSQDYINSQMYYQHDNGDGKNEITEDSNALINRNLDQLTKKVTQLAIQESDQSDN